MFVCPYFLPSNSWNLYQSFVLKVSQVINISANPSIHIYIWAIHVVTLEVSIHFMTIPQCPCPGVGLEVKSRTLCYMELLYGSSTHLSHVTRKPTFCICKNKDADQLRGNREADQQLCFRYIYSTIPLISISEISSL